MDLGDGGTVDVRAEDSQLAAVRDVKRRLLRTVHRHKPGAALGVACGVVLAAAVLDFIGPTQHWLNGIERNHPVAIGLIENGLLAALAAAIAYYALRGRRCQKALSSYRKLARSEPDSLVDGFADRASLVRRRVCVRMAEQIAMSSQASLTVVQGRAGADRTSFVAGLTQALAQAQFVPVPIVAKGLDALDVRSRARQGFSGHIDRALASDAEADAVWRRARSDGDLIFVVDGLDEEGLDQLWQDDAVRLCNHLKRLLDEGIYVVLVAASRELLFPGLPVQREQLDAFGEDEAVAFLRRRLSRSEADAAVEVLQPLSDPVGGFDLAPYYLDLIVRLYRGGGRLSEPPRHLDRWRAHVLEGYIAGARGAEVVTGRRGFDDLPAPEKADRGRAAVDAAREVAEQLVGDAEPPLERRVVEGKVSGAALRDAQVLRLLSLGETSVGFPSDDLAAYLVAETAPDAKDLVRRVQRFSGSSHRLSRSDRDVLSALIFWHLRSRKSVRLSEFKRVVRNLDARRRPRPAAVAAAVRIAGACDVPDPGGRLAEAAERSIDRLEAAVESGPGPDEEAWEMVRLVRALSGWPSPAAHRILWKLAAKRGVEVEWPAAKALALAEADPHSTLAGEFDEVIGKAELADPVELSRPVSDTGDRVASLAWILPALRGADGAEQQLERVIALCLAEEMSPLRGEMSLAQGLKFALLHRRAAEGNLEYARRLLGEGKLRFWHARLVVVQAMLAHAWQHTADAARVKDELASVREHEKHPLVRAGIDLARAGTSGARAPKGRSTRLGDYMWTHEREAVRWVEQRKGAAARLLGDSVLLSNMVYRLRGAPGSAMGASAPDDLVNLADQLAGSSTLPRCFKNPNARFNIDNQCRCNSGACTRREGAAPAVRATRATFSEGFCREQARLVATFGTAPWVSRRPMARGKLKEFWEKQAANVGPSWPSS